MNTISGKSRERGYSLVEMIIVVALLGTIAAMATIKVGDTLKRMRTEAAAQDFKGFLDNVFLLANQGVYFDDTSGDVSRFPSASATRVQVSVFTQLSNREGDGFIYADIMPDVNNNGLPDDPVLDPDPNTGHSMDAFRLTNDLSLSQTNADEVGGTWPLSGGIPTIMCDNQGRAIDPNTRRTITTTAVMPVTHREMVDDNIYPKVSYTVSVTPLWQVTTVKEFF